MKKLFTMMTIGAAALAMQTAYAGTPVNAKQVRQSTITFAQTYGHPSSSLRAASCDTIINITQSESVGVSGWQAPSAGYVAGNASIQTGATTFSATTGVGEYFHPTLLSPYVNFATVGFGVAVINTTHADSLTPVTAYVYDASGTGGSPGHAYDSATLTLGEIALSISDTLLSLFTFTHQAVLPAGGFFITVTLPQIAGDSIAVATTSGATGLGQGWLEISGFGWASYPNTISGDSLVDDYIAIGVCGTACPTITTTATEIGHTKTASVTATGGVAPYTYAWSNSQTTDTATGLTNGQSYTVTATDANGCSGTATVSISTGIESIGDISNFNIYPNPSNGLFTASIHLAAASDVAISIVDVTGAKVYETTENAVKDLDKQINLDGIAAGIYFVNVKTAKGTANQRIVIK